MLALYPDTMPPVAQPPLPSVQRGTGSPLVLLHGMGLSPHTYAKAIDLLSVHVRVVAPMWLYVAGRWSEQAVTSALGATLDAVTDDAVTLVGHSFGGALAMLAAAARPDRVKRLVLVNCLGSSGPETMRETALSVQSGRRLVSFRAGRDFLGSVTTRPRDVGRAGWWAYKRDFEPEIQQLAATPNLDRHVLWTRDDCVLPAADGEQLAQRLDATWTIVDGGQKRLDHDWAYRHPDQFARTLLELDVARG